MCTLGHCDILYAYLNSQDEYATTESSISSAEDSSPSSIDPDTFLGPELAPTMPVLPTFKIVGDNIDKEIKPRNMRSDYDGGTLFQLRNLINRRNVVKTPMSSVSACEDFLLHVVETHIVSACMAAFGMSTVDDIPTTFQAVSAESTLQRRRTLLEAIDKVITSHVNFSIGSSSEVETPQKDHVLEYGQEILTLGLLYMEFIDAVREGDGERIVRCWRYFLLIFKATGRKNYSIEAFTFLCQYSLFSQRECKCNYNGVELSMCMDALERTSHVICTWST